MKYLSWIPGEYFGGCESYALRVAQRAKADGLTVTVVCTSRTCAEEIRKRSRELRVLVLSGFQIAARFRGRRLMESFLQILLYIKSLAVERPDLVHAVLPWHAHSVEWIYTCTMLRIPLMITFQLVGPESRPDGKHFRVFRKARERGARFCAVSEQNKRLLCDYYSLNTEDVSVVYNRSPIGNAVCLDPEVPREIRRKVDVSGDATMILTVGGLREQKGYDLIIHAIPKIVSRFPEVIFVWVGDGAWEDYLKELATRCGVQNKILMLGHRTDVAQLLSAADLFLLPSRYEGESFALCEAAASALPIVASDASGIPELLRDGLDAYLFRTGDAGALAESVCAALSDSDDAARRGLSARERVGRYTEEEMFRDTFKLLRALHSSRQRGDRVSMSLRRDG